LFDRWNNDDDDDDDEDEDNDKTLPGTTHHGEVYSILLSPGKCAARMVTL
jgi:hypothetical protein